MRGHEVAGEEMASILIVGSTVRYHIFVIVAGQIGGSFEEREMGDGMKFKLGRVRSLAPRRQVR